MLWQRLESIGEALSEAFMPSKPVKKQPVTEKHSRDGRSRSLGLSFGHSSMQGWRDRMEDAHCSAQLRRPSGRGTEAYLFGVCDGHGGDQVAKFCARHLPLAVDAARSRGRTVPDALHESFHGLDRLLQDPACADELLELATDEAISREDAAHACGCTVAACCVTDAGEVAVANAGDCRVVLSRLGNAIDLSHDHKPSLPIEHARITNAGGRLVERRGIKDGKIVARINGGLNVSRTIGDFKYKQNENLPPNGQMVSCTPEITSFRRTPQDEFLLVACDGIWDVLSSQQAVDFVHQRLPALRSGAMRPSQVAEECLDICISPNLSWTGGLGGDNMTLMIVVFSSIANDASHVLPTTAVDKSPLSSL